MLARFIAIVSSILAVLAFPALPWAQTPPSPSEIATYRGLLAASANGDTGAVLALLDRGAVLEQRDGNGRTPLLVAVYRGHVETAKLLLARGADANAKDSQNYDMVTIAAVADDRPMLELALTSGGKAGNVTSPYQGTALIASAHRGHVWVVKRLIEAKAPLDHVNNLGWTALIEAIILGDGGPDHTEIVRLLVAAGANVNIPDRAGATPLSLASARGHAEMVRILRQAGAK